MQNSNDLLGYGKDHYHDLQRDIRCFPTKTLQRGGHPRQKRVSLADFITNQAIHGEAWATHKQLDGRHWRGEKSRAK